MCDIKLRHVQVCCGIVGRRGYIVIVIEAILHRYELRCEVSGTKSLKTTDLEDWNLSENWWLSKQHQPFHC